MRWRLSAIIVVLALLLVACGGAEEPPLPTLASVDQDETSSSSDENPTPTAESAGETTDTMTEDTAADEATSADSASATSLDIGITDDLTPPEMVGEGTINATDSNGVAYTLTFDLPVGWSIEGDSITNGTVTIMAEVWAQEGEALMTVIEGTYPGDAANIVFAQNMEYLTGILHAYDSNTNRLYVTWNTSGDSVFNPYTAIVEGSLADIQAVLSEVLAITDSPTIATS